ncbi:unnamed protein product [Lactuca virosa]|uniref:Uncharacterized protein n=1 Tax=Lactuca virosa TaxID=75947 RepID=A0AAU9LGW4_9ASTR|nr:unnamed protein product [Lactuca virosa]
MRTPKRFTVAAQRRFTAATPDTVRVIPTPMAARRLTDTPAVGSRRRLAEEEKEDWRQRLRLETAVDRSFHRLEDERKSGGGG